MSDSEKSRMKSLDDLSDYTLSRIRVPSALNAKGLENVFESPNDRDKGLNSKETAPNETDEQSH